MANSAVGALASHFCSALHSSLCIAQSLFWHLYLLRSEPHGLGTLEEHTALQYRTLRHFVQRFKSCSVEALAQKEQ